jgi:hypothetical protein
MAGDSQRLSRESSKLRWWSPLDACLVVGVARPPSHSDEKGTAVTNNYQSGVLDSTPLHALRCRRR